MASSSSSKPSRPPMSEYHPSEEDSDDIPDDPDWESESPIECEGDSSESEGEITDREEREWTKEEELLYYRTLNETEGFDAPKLPDNGTCGGLFRLSNCSLKRRYIRQCAEVGIKDFNSQNGADFEFVEIEKACSQIVCGCMLYLTLKVRPKGMPSDYPTTSLQAKVLYGIGENNITTEFCGLTPEGK